MNISEIFTGWSLKDKKQETEHDYIGEINNAYFYRLTNLSKQDIQLCWKDEYPVTIKAGATAGYRGVSLHSFSWLDAQGKKI